MARLRRVWFAVLASCALGEPPPICQLRDAHSTRGCTWFEPAHNAHACTGEVGTRAAVPPPVVTCLKGDKKSGTTWLEMMVQSLLRAHCASHPQACTYAERNRCAYALPTAASPQTRPVVVGFDECPPPSAVSARARPAPAGVGVVGGGDGSAQAPIVCGSKHHLARGLAHRQLAIVRDPRDVAVSRWFYLGVKRDGVRTPAPPTLDDGWALRRVQKSAAEIVRAFELAQQACAAHLLRYDAMLARPEPERVRALLAVGSFIGLDGLGGESLREEDALRALRENAFDALRASGKQVVAHGGLKNATKLRQGAAHAFAQHMSASAVQQTTELMRSIPLVASMYGEWLRR